MATETAPRPRTVTRTTGSGRPSRVAAVRALLLAQAAALAVLVALDGSTTWRLARVLVVIAMTAAVVVRPNEVVALVAGVLGTVAGAGIGVMHLIRVGATVEAVAGMVCLGTGLALLVSGTLSFTRRLVGWWRLLVVPAAAVVLVFVLYPVTMAVYATNVPPSTLGPVTPADRGLAFEDVVLHTADGVRLSAWYIPSANGAAVALLHGSGSTRSSTLAHSVVLAEHGYGVLLVDARGHGRSGGDAMDFGWYGDPDIAAATAYLAGRSDIDANRIGLVGLSMGGEQAIGAIASDKRIRAVVAEGVTGRVRGDFGWLPDHPGRYVNLGIQLVEFTVADLLSGAQPPIDLPTALETSDRPVLLIQGAAVPGRSEVLAGRHLRNASPDTVELWEIPHAGHTGGLVTAADEWTARVIGFLDRTLPS